MSTSVSSSPECDVAVFRRGQRTNSLPAARIPREQAQWMVDCGAARWVNNRYKSVQMVVEEANAKLRDLSAMMGPRVIEQAAAGSTYHAALAQGWKPQEVRLA